MKKRFLNILKVTSVFLAVSSCTAQAETYLGSIKKDGVTYTCFTEINKHGVKVTLLRGYVPSGSLQGDFTYDRADGCTEVWTDLHNGYHRVLIMKAL